MTPFDIFMMPGSFLLELLCIFLQVPSGEMEPALYTVYAFFLALMSWAGVVRVTSEVIRRFLGFGPRGRY